MPFSAGENLDSPRAAVQGDPAGERQLRTMTLRLNRLGRITACEGPCESALGYAAEELVGRHVGLLVPYLGTTQLCADGKLDRRVVYLSHCGFGFETVKADGSRVAAELHFSVPGNEDCPPEINLLMNIREPALQIADASAGRAEFVLCRDRAAQAPGGACNHGGGSAQAETAHRVST